MPFGSAPSKVCSTRRAACNSQGALAGASMLAGSLSQAGGSGPGPRQRFHGPGTGVGNNGQSLGESQGVERCLAEARRDALGRIDEEMLIWARTFRQAYGSKSGVFLEREEAGETEEMDPYAHREDTAEDEWDRREAAGDNEMPG